MTTDDGLKWYEIQDWKGLYGMQAFQLIKRHAEGWEEINQAMNAWLAANVHDSGVRALVGKWRNQATIHEMAGGFTNSKVDQLLRQCADELAAILAEKGEV